MRWVLTAARVKTGIIPLLIIIIINLGYIPYIKLTYIYSHPPLPTLLSTLLRLSLVSSALHLLII